MIGKALILFAVSTGVAAPALAQPPAAKSEAAALVAQRERDTNNAMLAALVQRRAEVVASTGNAEGKVHALRFLDTRIAEVRKRLGR